MSLSVCVFVRDHIFGTTCPIFSNFLCMLPMAVARSSSGGVVMYVMYFRFIEDVIFVYRPRLLDVAAQLKRSAHSLELGYWLKLCAVIPVAGQRTHGTTFRALKVFTRWQHRGAESAVCYCFVNIVA